MQRLGSVLSWFGAVVMACLMVSCNEVIYDYDNCPEEPGPGEPQFVLQLNFSRELPPYVEIFYSFGQVRSWRGEVPTPDFRCIINVYPEDENAREPLYTFVHTQPGEAPGVINLPLELPVGNYRFRVWADYVQPGSQEDNYYDTTEWTAIRFDAKNYSGCDDSRDAFRGVSDHICVIPEEKVHVVDMERPLAKYRFISTDFDVFLQSRGYSLLPLQSPSDIPQAPNFNPDDYYIVMRYTGFVPWAFNNFTNRPSDATVGVSYRGDFNPLGGNEVELAFDYVFVNGREAQVDVAIDIYTKDGVRIASSPSMSVPIIRSHLTTVRGAFLTTQSSGAVGVNPDFDGSFDIIINN